MFDRYLDVLRQCWPVLSETLGDHGIVVMFGADEGCDLMTCREGDEAALNCALFRLCRALVRLAGVPVETRNSLVSKWMSRLKDDLERSRSTQFFDEYEHADDLLDDIPY